MLAIEETNTEHDSSTDMTVDKEVEPEHAEINDHENSIDMIEDDFDEELSDSHEDDSNSETEIKGSGNAAWADAMGRVLNTNISKPKNFILSKAKKDADVKVQDKDKEEVELVDESGKILNVKKSDKDSKVKTFKEQKQEILERQKQKAAWENMCRVKPDIIKREKERELVRIATRGVVHLFNTVEKHQKSVKNPKEKNANKKNLGAVKGSFMDILKGHCKRQHQSEDDPVMNKVKREETWSILKDDFMMGAEMKDWDKDSDDNT